MRAWPASRPGCARSSSRRTLSDFEADGDDEPAPIKTLKTPVNTAKRQVEDLVDREPDRVAAQVRAWMAED